MNRALSQAVIQALSFSPQTRNLEPALDHFSESAWERSFPWLDASGITLYLWRQINRLRIQEAVPFAVRAKFARRQRDNSYRAGVMVEESARLQEYFYTAGVRYAVLKGLALIPDYCPDPSLRIQFDHDYLVDGDSLPGVEQVLRRVGYSRKNSSEPDRAIYVQPFPTPDRSFSPAGFYSAELPRPVELHLKLWDSSGEGIVLALPGNLLDRVLSRTVTGRVFPVLSDEDALLFQVLHAFRHILHHWCRLSVLFEIAHFLHARRGDVSFWRRFCARLGGNPQSQRIAGVVLGLAASVFEVSLPLPGPPSASFPLTPELKLWIDRYGTNSAAHNFSGNKHSLFLFHAFAEDPGTRRRITWRRLFPWHRPHGLRSARKESALPDLTAVRKRGGLLLRRFSFHLRAVIRYAVEYPQWQFLIWRSKRKYSYMVAKASAQGLRQVMNPIKPADRSAARDCEFVSAKGKHAEGI